MSQPRSPSAPGAADRGHDRDGLHRPSHEFGLYRKLHERGVPIPARITSTDLRRELREVLARVEYSALRVEILRQGQPVACILPLADLRQYEEFERTGIRHYREHLSLIAEMAMLRARTGE